MKVTRAAPRIPRAAPLHRRKPSSRRNPAHLDFIRSLPCLKCGAPAPSEAAHIRIGTDGGTGLKPSDKFAAPLCHRCHIAEQHQRGERSFWGELGIDPLDVAARLYAVSGAYEQGLRTILRARLTMMRPRK